jgi:hypothetical protein
LRVGTGRLLEERGLVYVRLMTLSEGIGCYFVGGIRFVLGGRSCCGRTLSFGLGSGLRVSFDFSLILRLGILCSIGSFRVLLWLTFLGLSWTNHNVAILHF